MQQIIECVPNVSEGKNLAVIEDIQKVIMLIHGVKLLHTDIGNSANRTVFTFAGEPKMVIEAAFQLIKKASELIDMSKHAGIHPRIGAVDVCPIVPIQNISMDEVIGLSRNLSQRVGEELNIPVYCYEESALSEARRRLENIRREEYEGLYTKMQLPEWIPDYGPKVFNPKFGAIVIGARNILLAYNINLGTNDINIAKQIAEQIRESGKKTQGRDGLAKKTFPTTLNYVKAIGWYVKDYGFTQVSTNITDFNKVPIYMVFETVKKLAKELNVKVNGSELIGLIPLNALKAAGEFYNSKVEILSDRELINFAIEALELSKMDAFDPSERVIEYLLGINLG